MLILPLGAFAQGVLSGKVIDVTTSKPLEGAAVTISGTSNGVFTDSEGSFSLKNIKSGQCIQ